jgi:hypothetical protein
MTVILSGFADEISPDLRAQLAALAAESISHLELRSAWSVNIADLTDQQLAAFRAAVDEAGYTMMLADIRESGTLERQVVERALPAVDGIVLAGPVTPALTTLAAPLPMMGATAVTNLIALTGGARSRSDQPAVLPVKLMVRASTAPRTGNTIAPSPGAGKVSGPAGAG